MDDQRFEPQSQQINDAAKIKVSLVIPVRDEAGTINQLLASIAAQKRQPDEIVIVDGGSQDKTLNILNEARVADRKIRVIEASKASPGQGRNIGIANARFEWIALTDAGVQLDSEWLARLMEVAQSQPDVDMVCGNFEPQIDSFFKECAAIVYVPAKRPMAGGNVRGPFIASSLVRRAAWRSVGGFPDLRASEDLIFFEELQRKGFKLAWASAAMVYWELRASLLSTILRFFVYSCVNVWAGRVRRWHFGLFRYYIFSLPFVVLAVWKSLWWLLVPLIVQTARVGRSIWVHREGRGLPWLINPLRFGYVVIITLAIDLATLAGWAVALLKRGEATRIRNHMLTRRFDEI